MKTQHSHGLQCLMQVSQAAIFVEESWTHRVAHCQESALMVGQIQVWRDQGQQGWESKSAQ